MKKVLMVSIAVFFTSKILWGIPSEDGTKPCPSMVNPKLEMKVRGIMGAPTNRGINNSLQTVGTNAVLVLRVDFPNRQFLPQHDYNHFVGVFTGSNSPQQYYLDQSDNQANFVFTVSQNVYRLPQSSCFYSNNPRQLIIDSVRAADGDINFNQYNALMILHAGPDQASTGGNCDIWSMYVFWSPPFTTNEGAAIYDGTIIPEGEGTSMNQSIVGVVVHEFGHNLGLPDLYSYYWSGAGIWSLMAIGNMGGDLRHPDSPTSLDAWSRVVLDWTTPDVKSGVSEDIELLPFLSSSDKILKLPARGDPNAQEYFLLEYRGQESWDRYIPKSGMLIWHIDETAPWDQKGSPPENFHVKPVQADGRRDLEKGNNSGDQGDPYPGSTGNHNFDQGSNPNSNLKNGQPSGVEVTSIQEIASKITAHVQVVGGPGSFFVTIIAPPDGSFIKKTANVSIKAKVTGIVTNVQKVIFYVDGVSIGEDYSGSGTPPVYEIQWDATNASDGAHNIKAEAVDSFNNKAEDSIRVMVDSQPPSVLLSSPDVGAWYSGQFTSVADVTDPSPGSGIRMVEFSLDGSVIARLFSPPWSTTIDTLSLTDGPHFIYARAEDNAGNFNQSPTVRFNVDNNKPTIAFVSPTDGARVSGTVNIVVNASDGTGSGIQSVDIFVDRRRLTTLLVPPFTTSWNTLLEIGKIHTLRADTRDNVGNSASATITVELTNDTIPPVISLLNPPSGSKVCGTVQVTLSASDNLALRSVDLYEGTQKLGSALASPFIIPYEPSTEGRHDLQATAVDFYDNTASTSFWFEVKFPGHTPPSSFDPTQDLVVSFQFPYDLIQTIQLFYRERGSAKPFMAKSPEIRMGDQATFRIPKALLSPMGIEYFAQVQTPNFLCESRLYSLTSPFASGDVNLDGVIDESDLLEVSFYFGVTSSDAEYEVRRDVNLDGVINEADFQEVLNRIS
ncbi:MAG: Ig-like domain-containing protein [bacterium JZ-2024 1]